MEYSKQIHYEEKMEKTFALPDEINLQSIQDVGFAEINKRIKKMMKFFKAKKRQFCNLQVVIITQIKSHV